MKHILFIGALAVALQACSDQKTGAQTAPIPAVSAPADDNADYLRQQVALPSMALRDVPGNPVSLEKLAGKKVFVNLWASWCPPCRREMPSIQALYRSVDTTKVVFVLIALDDDFASSKAFLRRERLQLPIYYPDQNLPALFNTESIPTTFIFDERGALLRRIDGSDDYDSDGYRNLLK